MVTYNEYMELDLIEQCKKCGEIIDGKLFSLNRMSKLCKQCYNKVKPNETRRKFS